MIILNFLAHLYLSENNTNIMIGNFIADHIKGNRFSHLNSEIQKGIRLHREIDTFTDSHVITKKSKRRLHKRYGLYAGIIIDIFYDHYLAKTGKAILRYRWMFMLSSSMNYWKKIKKFYLKKPSK